MITATPEAQDALRKFLIAENCQKPIRIHLQSTGCCDASLGLTIDDVREDDCLEIVEGLRFIVSPDVQKLAGNINLSYVSEKHREGFVLTSEFPISEWSGFGICKVSI